MTSFTSRIRPAVDAELRAARLSEASGLPVAGFRHLERAHVLGQSSTSQHVRVHARMMLWGLHNRKPAEVLGQVLRIVGAATKTAFGWVPTGNTGGASVSPFKPMPIPQDLQVAITTAQVATRADDKG